MRSARVFVVFVVAAERKEATESCGRGGERRQSLGEVLCEGRLVSPAAGRWRGLLVMGLESVSV